SRLTVNGNLTFTPDTVEVVWLGGTAFNNTQPYSWRVATATGNISIGSSQPTFNVTGLNTGGGAFSLFSGGMNVFVSFSPAPVPASILLGCAVAAAVRWACRHRRDRQRLNVLRPGERTYPC